MCDKGCYSGARVTCGKDMTASEVINEILLDKPYYTQGGGVTFSGGEPLAQAEFLKECITLCKQNGINVAVETSLIYYNEEIFKSLDFIMADFKIWDSATHKKYVGVPNDIIKENFKKLNSLNIPIIARTPLIPEIEQGIEEISKFLYSLDNVIEYEILPYHPIGNSKRIALGLEPDGFTVPSKEFLKEKSKYVFVRRKA
jgi:pyruvate formate lyase activating enzyme